MRHRFVAMIALLALAVGAASTGWFMRRPTLATPTASAPTAERQALYWYDPMVPNQHFDQPGKSPFMDMQLVPKYAGAGDNAAGVVSIDARQVQNLGVRTALATRGSLTPTVRATGTVAFDERLVSVVQARVAGIVEHLEVRAPLSAVRQGQPLLTLLAPEWTAAQEEYLTLRRATSSDLDEVRDAARRRLVLLGMDEAQIRAVERSGQAQVRIVVSAPRAGVVGELAAREGASIMPGTPLLRLNGLERVWVHAAIPEAQVARLRAGTAVTAELTAYPDESFHGEIEAMLPDVDVTTRTQTARIVLDNGDRRLVPGMFARITATPTAEHSAILAPTEAVIATGARSVVIVAEGSGRFRAQEVRIGDEAQGQTEVREGLAEGDRVVLSGQFLIDSEASLSGTLARLGGTDDTRTGDTGASSRAMHRAAGTVERLDGRRLTVRTDAIPSLDMGAMSMTFVLPASIDGSAVGAGQRIAFSFVRNDEGDFVLDALEAAGAGVPSHAHAKDDKP